MATALRDIPVRRAMFSRFWSTARQFWQKDSAKTAWPLTIGLGVLILLQLAVQLRLNVWNRDLFNALERKDGEAVAIEALIFLPLATALVGLGILAVYGRMRAQREWRAWLTERVVDRWLTHGRYYQLNLVRGEHQNPEARIAENIRVATDAPIDFAVGIASAFVTAATFIGVLWVVGGNFKVEWHDATIVIPGYLVIAALLYSLLASGGMILFANRFVAVSEDVNQVEAEYRYALTRLRDNGESIALLGGENEERAGLRKLLSQVMRQWLLLAIQHMRATLVSNGNTVLAPVIPLVLCAPKYLEGAMTLGEVTQAAAAFVLVQSAFNWIVDNYPRWADWMASVRRVASLLISLDYLDQVEESSVVIQRAEYDGKGLRLRNLSVTLDDGTVVIRDADVVVEPGEKVLVRGESGTGKSTLMRAIAGLWPWGKGDIFIPRGARLFLMPQRPYVPLGALRRVATYPLAAQDVSDDLLRELFDRVGLGHLSDRLGEEAPWDDMLSGGEKQRIAFVRLMLHRPDFIVMDEATSALDPESQERMLVLIGERLPQAAIISIAHRPELEAFHQRVIVFEHRPGGSRLIKDTQIAPSNGLLLKLWTWLRRSGNGLNSQPI